VAYLLYGNRAVISCG